MVSPFSSRTRRQGALSAPAIRRTYAPWPMVRHQSLAPCAPPALKRERRRMCASIAFAKALIDPPEPTEALRKAAADYRAAASG